jgi:putative peptide zinc metalloprotease protein
MDGALLELVVEQGARVPLVGEVTIGRSPDSTVVLRDPAVSRRHARISESAVEDLGSLSGTFLDGRRVGGRTPLRDGARLRIGDTELLVAAVRDPLASLRTIVVPAGARSASASPLRLRPGYALKRLEAAEGDRRWVLRDLEHDAFLRFGDADAQLVELLDGTHTPTALVERAEQRLGPAGPQRLARLLADLGDRGLLDGVDEAARPQRRSLLRPRERVLPSAGAAVARAYRRGGWILATRPALVALALIAFVGAAAFAYLVAARYGTPFVVASHLGLGGLVFLLGRFGVVAVHELAHGLAMASFGRPVERAGVKLLLIFPYAFVDTSQAWFEPRRRRIAISAAGPGSDLVLGALFSLACLLQPAGAVRDVCFQLAFAAYIGALFNLNPFLDRDGHHILADVLREPKLRRQPRFVLLSLGWSVVAALLAIGMSLRYRAALEAVAPAGVVWALMGAVWAALLAPVALRLRRR